MNSINIYINNYNIKTKADFPLIKVLQQLKLAIPRFCYHSQLSIAGNCRMCLIEVKNSLKPIASCAVHASENMYIYTNSRLVKEARESVMEFLLINHPLDCPICDQGGECDLQDISFVFGTDRSRFYE
jgi:NADH dehydrogenase/NADH:ubiquinone oxidoreductase subunit G